MSAAFKLKMAKQTAEKLLRDDGIETLPVDPFAIAASRDIVVQAKDDAEPGVSGMLLRHGNTFGLMYSTFVENDGFQRFSVAHELGHYFLEGHCDALLQNGVHSSSAGFTSADPYELEADFFAAGLLMPGTPFKRLLGRRDPGLEAIEFLAGECRTSLTATAIRCAELSDDALAVVVSQGSTIDFCFLSDRMKSLPGISWIRKGSALPVEAETFRFNQQRDRVLAGDRAFAEIDSQDWLGGTRPVRLNEEVAGLGRYGKTLTVLSSVSLAAADEGYDDEGDEEKELIALYTPRFRK